MTESSSMKDWQLEESAATDNQWQLLDTEQELPPELKLEDGDGPQQGWQPIEDTEAAAGGGRNWILPSFIILAMIAVVSYIGWLGFNGGDLLPPAEQAAVVPADTAQEPSITVLTPEATEEAAATATPLPAPTATVEEIAAVAPTPALVEQSVATIASEYGLNARLNPSTEGDPVALLDNGAEYPIVEQGPEWTQIQLDDGTRVWVSSDFIEVATETVPVDVAVAPPPADAGAEEAADAGSAADEVVAVEQRTTGITPPEPFTNIIPDGPAVLVLVEGGVNARTEPNTEATNVIQTIPQGAALQAVAQSADGEWTQVEMPNATLAWVFLGAVDTSGDIAGLGVAGEEPAAEAQPEEIAEVPAPAAEGIEPTPAPEAEAEPVADSEDQETAEQDAVASEDAQITVDSLIGVKARIAPQLDAEAAEIISRGTSAPATGRTADGAWIQITLTSGDPGWVLVGAVQLNVAPETLPVVEP